MSGKKTPTTMMSASRLPSLLGLSKYMTPNDELHLSISALKGELNNFEQNEAMAWGDRLEEIILLETSKRLQLTDLQTEFSSAFYHATLPLACSLDGYADGRGQVIKNDHDAGIFVIGADQIVLDGFGVLEAKLTSVQAEEIPALYRGPVQLQAQMDIMQAKWGCVSVLYRGTELRIFLFEPHQQTLATIKQAVLDFQDKLEKYKTTGAVDFYPPATSDDADRMYPSAAGESIVLDVEAELLADKIVDAKDRITKAEKDRSDAEKDLKTMLKTAPKGVAGKYEISWPMRNYAAQAQKIVKAKDAYSIRQSTLSIKEFKK
jgi:predicted phage-related endonuclease